MIKRVQVRWIKNWNEFDRISIQFNVRSTKRIQFRKHWNKISRQSEIIDNRMTQNLITIEFCSNVWRKVMKFSKEIFDWTKGNHWFDWLDRVYREWSMWVTFFENEVQFQFDEKVVWQVKFCSILYLKIISFSSKIRIVFSWSTVINWFHANLRWSTAVYRRYSTRNRPTPSRRTITSWKVGEISVFFFLKVRILFCFQVDRLNQIVSR